MPLNGFVMFCSCLLMLVHGKGMLKSFKKWPELEEILPDTARMTRP